MMRKETSSTGFTLLEVAVASAIFAVLAVVVCQLLRPAQTSMRTGVALNSVEGTASRLIDAVGRDVRETSYAYVFAGDWSAYRDANGVVSIDVARNYLSATPTVGGSTLAPGIADEGWSECTNPACSWAFRSQAAGVLPIVPRAFLGQPTRNNPQTGSPANPPASFSFTPSDARGRLFGHLPPGGTCPFCGFPLGAEVHFGGLMVFSPRKADRTFSYGGSSGYEPRWQSIVFYCPFRDPQTGFYDIRRYAFFAESIQDASGVPADLYDLLDFDGDLVIESPPMTDFLGAFVLDADGEQFGLAPDASAGNRLSYARWDSALGRSFRIDVDRRTGAATVVVGGSAFAGTHQVRTAMRKFGLGVSDFEASTFLNNPSWYAGGTRVNPEGVIEPGAVRITFQVDRPSNPSRRQTGLGFEETVQTVLLCPRN